MNADYNGKKRDDVNKSGSYQKKCKKKNEGLQSLEKGIVGEQELTRQSITRKKEKHRGKKRWRTGKGKKKLREKE